MVPFPRRTGSYLQLCAHNFRVVLKSQKVNPKNNIIREKLGLWCFNLSLLWQYGASRKIFACNRWAASLPMLKLDLNYLRHSNFKALTNINININFEIINSLSHRELYSMNRLFCKFLWSMINLKKFKESYLFHIFIHQ